MNILYATSNKDKITSANKNLESFNITLEGISVPNIVEMQSDNIEEIAIDKAKQAFEYVKKPLIAGDAGWYIPSLNGFPGPLMAYVNKWLSSEDFLNLIRDKEDKSIELVEYLVYIDSDNIQVFKQKTVGRFLDEAEGEGRNLDKVITFREEDNKSVARCLSEGEIGIQQYEMWEGLGEYLSKLEHK